MRRCLCFGIFGLVVACSAFGVTDPPREPTAPDAGVEAGEENEHFCETAAGPNGTAPLFCRDFDDGQSHERGWDETTETNGSVAIDSVNPRSAPASFRARVPPDVDSCAYARVIKTVENVPDRLRLGFDVRLGGEGTRPDVLTSFMAIEFVGACTLILHAREADGVVFEQPGDHIDMEAGIPHGKWTHVEVDTDRNTRELAIRLDGNPAFSRAMTLEDGCPGNGDKIRLLIGIHCAPRVDTPRVASLDNIVLTRRP